MMLGDGIVIDGHGMKYEESSATGESDLMKTAADRVMMILSGEAERELKKLDPFILSGSKVC